MKLEYKDLLICFSALNAVLEHLPVHETQQADVISLITRIQNELDRMHKEEEDKIKETIKKEMD